VSSPRFPRRPEARAAHLVREELVRVAREFTQGNAVAVLPVYAELTAEEAVDLLSVSRPYLIG